MSDVDDCVGSERAAGAVLSAVSLDALRAALDGAPVLVTVTAGPEHRLVWRNRLAVQLYGPRQPGRPLVELFPDLAGAIAPWDRAFQGEVVVADRGPVSTDDAQGRRRAMRHTLAPLRGPDGAVLGVVQLAADATAEMDAEEQANRARLLADIADTQAAAGDAGGALQGLADRLVPEMADLAAVYVFADLAAAGGSEALTPVALALGGEVRRAGLPPRPARRARLSRWESLLTAGIPVAIDLDGSTLEDLDPHADMRAWLLAARAHSLAVAPLVVAGEMTGAVLLLAAGDRGHFEQRDLEFLRAVTDRAGATIAEVRGRQRDRDAAERLQHALLPSLPPAVPGARVAARYLPATPHYPVGGDWWDLVVMSDGSLALGIGDISGHGLEAAALMGQAQVAMHTAANAGLAPAQVLGLVDAQLTDVVDQQRGGDLDLHRFATALYAATTPDRSHVRIASAGHLPLIRKPSDGPAQPVWAPAGPPLGVGTGAYDEVVIALGPGDLLAAYTDGLVEDRTLAVGEGITRLAATLDAASEHADLQVVADTILAGMGRLDGSNEDDIALVLVRLTDDRR